MKQKTHPTQLEACSRRQSFDLLVGGVAAMTAFPQLSNAFSQQLDDYAFEPQQQATDGKFDLNAAAIGEYKVLRGMFPTAGK